MIGLGQSGAAQTSTSPPTTDSNSQTKQDKKTQKAKTKMDKATARAQSGKKTTTSQDAAYALAARKGIPDHENVPPK
jgi:hypothetical protein